MEYCGGDTQTISVSEQLVDLGIDSHEICNIKLDVQAPIRAQNVTVICDFTVILVGEHKTIHTFFSPDFSKPFVVHTDASHTQLQNSDLPDDKPIAFYSHQAKACDSLHNH
jgi:hypothetical protein